MSDEYDLRVPPSVKKIIDALPSNGEWWKEENRRAFEEVGTSMRLMHLPPETIELWLTKLYNAVSSEYGD